MATSLGEKNDWAFPGAEIKTQIYIDNDGTYYRTYVDLNSMTLISNFYHDNQLLGRAEWQFTNTTWYQSPSERNVVKPAQLSNTTFDPVTGASMTIRSSDLQDNDRNYRLRVNEKFTMEEFITISDPWTFEQLISMKDSNIEDNANHSINTRIQYTGAFWR